MKKFNKKWGIGLAIAVIAVTYTVFATPGSDTDPAVSLSYLTRVFKPQVKEEVQQTLQFQVISVESGKTLQCEAGAELILRMGTAKVVASQMGGLSDVTAGYDLGENTNVPANHLLIVPKSDGRGISATTDCLVMVKGNYTVE